MKNIRLPRQKVDFTEVRARYEEERLKQIPIERKVYEAYQQSFDKAIETAFENIVWLGSPEDAMFRIQGNTIPFKIDNTFSIIGTIALIEQKYNPDSIAVQHRFLWKAVVTVIANETMKIYPVSRWRRKHRQGVVNIMKAFFQSCGLMRPSFKINDGVYIAWGIPSKEDIEVIKIAEEMRRSELTGQDELSNKSSDEGRTNTP